MVNYKFYILKNGVKYEVEEPLNFKDFSPKYKRDDVSHGVGIVYDEIKLSFAGFAFTLLNDTFSSGCVVSENVSFIVDYICGEYTFNLFVGDFNFLDAEVKGCVFFCSVSIEDPKKRLYDRSSVDVDLYSTKTLGGLNTTAVVSEVYDTKMTLKRYSNEYVNNNSANTSFTFFVPDFPLPFGSPVGDDGLELQTSIVPDFGARAFQKPIFTAKYDGTFKLKLRNVSVLMNWATQSAVSENVCLYLDYDFSPSGKIKIATLKSNERLNISNQTYTFELKKGARVAVFFAVENYASNFYAQRFELFPCETYAEYTSYDMEVSDNAFKKMYAAKVVDVLDKLVGDVSDKLVQSHSDFFQLDSLGRGYALASGFMLRFNETQNLNNDRLFKITLSTFLKELQNIFCVGWGFFQNVFRLERLDFFYQSDEVYRFENIPNVVLSFDKEVANNEFNFGYSTFLKDKNPTDRNVLHGQRKYTAEKVNVKSNLDKISNFIADNFLIDAQTEAQFSKKSEANDKKFFIINMRGSAVNVESVSLGLDYNGGNFKNVSITPYRCAMNWSELISQQLAICAGSLSQKYSLIDSAALANFLSHSYADVRYFGSKPTLNDSASIPLQASRWLPYEVNFEVPITLEEHRIISENLHGLFFVNNYAGWIKSYELNLNNGIAKFILKCANPNFNFQK